MTFVEAFYSFTIEITNVDREIYSSPESRIRIKLARHPNEPLEYMYARVLAFVHAYRPDLTFSEGWFAQKNPVLWAHNLVGDVTAWVDVGISEGEKVHRAIKRWPEAEFRIYLYQTEQIETFCHYLRSHSTHWIKTLQLYRIAQPTLDAIVALEKRSSRWSATVIDSTVYLTIDGVDLELSFESIDLWEAYQRSIGNG